jgi:hypothetical protein
MLTEITFRDEKRHLREMSVGDVFSIQRELKSKPSSYDLKVKYYKEEGLLTDPIPSFILEELAELREEDKKVRKTFLSDFYYDWLVSLDGIKFIIEMLIVEKDIDEETLAGLCLNSENTTKIIELINDFGKKNYDTVQKAAEKKAGTKKKATKKATAKQKRVAKKKTKKNPRNAKA